MKLFLAALFPLLLVAQNKTSSLHITTGSFTENKGQVHDQNFNTQPDILFSGNEESLFYYLKKDGLSYQLGKKTQKAGSLITDKQPYEKEEIYRIDLRWLNCNLDANINGGEEQAGYSNYYLENCPNGVLNVKCFGKLRYNNIYPGIDLI